MPSLDTNALLRWLIGDMPDQADRVLGLLASGKRFAVDDCALVELVYVLERTMRLSRPLVADAVQTVLTTASLDVDRAHWNSLTALYLGHPKLSVTDIHLALRARDTGATPLYTFDRKLASQLADAELL